MRLHLGVVELPYSSVETAAQKRARRRKGKRAPVQTTGDVAEILEARYGVMGTFYDRHQREIATALAKGVQGAIESIVAGAPPTVDPFADGTQKIKTMFDRFITSKEMDAAGVEGVPTEASLVGVSHRFKRRRGAPGRPSFVDTGLYLSSMRAWVVR
jgi:hypothetical protein